jgi:hypothetical protein
MCLYVCVYMYVYVYVYMCLCKFCKKIKKFGIFKKITTSDHYYVSLMWMYLDIS